jgi:putative membrane protein
MQPRFRTSLIAAAVSLAFAAGLSLSAQATGTYDKSTATTPATSTDTHAQAPANAMRSQAPATDMRAQTPSGAMPAQSSSNDMHAQAQLSSDDRKFIEKAAQGGVAEVKLGQLAADKATNSEVKKFGQRMVTDHSKANDKLMQIAKHKNITLPNGMDSSSQREFDKLSKLSGEKFDREYMKAMVSDHKKDVKEFQKEAKKATDSDLKNFAESTLPTLEDHLSLAKSAEEVAKHEGKIARAS